MHYSLLKLITLSSSSAFPFISLGLTIFGEVFVYVTVLCDRIFFYPTTEVVTFHLHGWCTLGVWFFFFVCVFCFVFLLAFTDLGHECQDLLSPCNGMHHCMWAQTRPQFILSSERVSGNGVKTHVNPKGKSPLLETQRRVELAMLCHWG